MKNGLIVDNYGTKRWYLNGKRHHKDGPATELANGNKWWYFNGNLHREDGPAITFTNGNKWWYLNNKEYSEEEYEVEIQKRKGERIKKEERFKEIPKFNYKLESLKL